MKQNIELSRGQMLLAREKILRNVKELMVDGRILVDHKRYERAVFIFSIACEEIGKYMIVTSEYINLVRGNGNWQRFWKRFSNHIDKIGITEFVINLLHSSDEDFLNPGDLLEFTRKLNNTKMSSLYVDLYDGEFLSPDEHEFSKYVEMLMTFTQNRLEYIESIEESTLELKHLSIEDVHKYDEMTKEMFGIDLFSR